MRFEAQRLLHSWELKWFMQKLRWMEEGDKRLLHKFQKSWGMKMSQKCSNLRQLVSLLSWPNCSQNREILVLLLSLLPNKDHLQTNWAESSLFDLLKDCCSNLTMEGFVTLRLFFPTCSWFMAFGWMDSILARWKLILWFDLQRRAWSWFLKLFETQLLTIYSRKGLEMFEEVCILIKLVCNHSG